jgi:hypothetical protein
MAVRAVCRLEDIEWIEITMRTAWRPSRGQPLVVAGTRPGVEFDRRPRRRPHVVRGAMPRDASEGVQAPVWEVTCP